MTISKKDVDAWDLEYAHLKWGGVAELSWIKNHLNAKDLILDAGSGEGRYLRHFCFNYDCIGTDISKNALCRSIEMMDEFAEKKSNSNSSSDSSDSNSESFSKPEHIVSNITELPFADNVFDGVLCLGVLQHLFLADREKAAAEFYRILKKGGRVFFEAFGESDMRCLGAPAFFEGKTEPRTFVRQNGIHYHYFEENELKKLFEKYGFETIEFKSIQKEKKYNGESYVRHHYRAVFKKY